MMKKSLFILCLSLCLAMHGQFRFGRANQEPVRIGIESREVFLGETVTFQIQVDSDDDQQGEAPVFPETPDFTVVPMQPQTSTSSSISIINGKRSESHTTTTTYAFQITPKKVGQLKLPELSIKAKGRTYHTQEIPIQVRPAEKLDDLKVTMTVSSTSCHVGEAVMLSWRWEVGRDVKNFQFALPILESDIFSYPAVEPKIDQSHQNEYLWIPLANGERLLGRRRTGAGGRLVVEFSRPAIAKKAGTFQLPASTVVCNVYDERGGGGQRSRWPFDDDDDFPSFFRTSRPTRRVSVQSEEVAFTVKELPENGRPANFSGIVGKCSIMCTADPLEVSVGDPIQLTVRLSGPAYLDDVRLPSLSAQEALARSFKVSGEDEPGIVEGEVKRFVRVLRANNAQVAEIPAIEVSYFDSGKGTYEVARSPAIPIQVKVAKQVTVQDAEGLGGTSVETAKMESEVKVHEGGLVNNYSVRELLVNDRRIGENANGMLKWVLLAVFPLVYVLVTGVCFVRDYARGHSGDAMYRRACRQCLQALDHAEKSGLTAVLDILRQYLGTKLHLTPEALTFSDVKARLEERGASAELLKQLKVLFTECEASRYAGSSSLDSGTACRQAKDIVRQLEKLF